ncbi:MAG: LTA synthase family protein [Bacilli bacterium]|nr:LTA synthase family protein [Bacilli bacterium]
MNPKTVKIKARNDKQNLIYIYVESLETSFFSYKNGGNFNQSVIPFLEELSNDDISFSRSDKYIGANSLNGTGWTTAGMVASTMGIPLKLGVDANRKTTADFLPGAYSLGEVLKDNGYKNYLFIGSSASFGQRDVLFKQHGDYKIYDYNTAKKDGWIKDDYYNWWGYEDNKLYKFAKDVLIDIADSSEPFNFTLLTADTHAQDGYVDEKCDRKYDETLLNSYNCADKMLSDFIIWLKKQDFYDKTTVVIVGDHYSMQGNMDKIFEVTDNDVFDRGIYNVFMNSKVDTKNDKNREFSTFDFFPTTLAAMGFNIEGDRLGLGTNLFSGKTTLIERDGVNQVNGELYKRSKFYNDRLFTK